MSHHRPRLQDAFLTRRDFLCRCGMGMGALGLGTLMAQTGLLAPAARAGGAINPLAPKAPHFPARAKRVIHIFLNGGPSHVDTFDQSRRSISTPTNRCRPAIYPLSA